MTMRVLLSGYLIRDTERKFGPSGRVYGKGLLRIAAKQRNETDPDSQLIFVTAFGDVAEQLLSLKQGDAIGISGELEVRAATYKGEPTVNLNVIADRLLDIKRPPRPQRSEAKPPDVRRDDDGTVGAMADDVPF